MAIKAVIFDLFGTLVFDKFSGEKYPLFLSRLAALLNLGEKDFTTLWQVSYQDRALGKFETLEDNLRWIGDRLGKPLEPLAVGQAASNIVELPRQALAPRTQALEVLYQLRLMGFKTGLISDCGPAVPLLWKETPFAALFDTAAFSCREGVKKPDPKFYQIVLERLGFPARECFYLGDGHSGELDGAKGMGMKPALIWSAIDTDEPERLAVKDWEGATLRTLEEVVSLLGS
jgi:putative hydrolase of the HAD superfamily